MPPGVSYIPPGYWECHHPHCRGQITGLRHFHPPTSPVGQPDPMWLTEFPKDD